MTWKEIKDKIEAEGIKDQDKIEYIDIAEDSKIEINKLDDGWEIFSAW